MEVLQNGEQLHQLQRGGDWVALASGGEVNSVFAHELAQPLSAMAGNATAARNAALGCPHQVCGNLEILEDLVADSARLRLVFQRVRALARDDLGARELEDVNSLISDTVQVASSARQVSGLAIRKRLGNRLPKVWLDPVQIQQVLLNLLGNAVDSVVAAGVSKPIVEVTSGRLKGGGVVIAVKDNGTGIPDALLPRLARDFVTTKADGTGIGLMLCRAMVERHDGALSAENNKPRGATFRVTLPVGRRAG